MQVNIIDFSERESWDQYVMKNPDSIAWQLFSWYEVLEENYTFQFYPLAAYRNSEICGVLPLYFYKTQLKSGSLISVPFAVAGGIVADDDEARTALLDSAIELSQKHNSCRIVLKQYKVKMPGDLTSDENYYNRELTLSQDIEKLKTEISSENLEKVAEAKDLNPQVIFPYDDIKRFYKLLTIHHQQRGIPCVTKKWVQSLLDSGMYSMALLQVDGKLMAGTMIKEFKDTISFPFTSMVQDSERHRLCVYYLYWHLIKHFAQEGKGIFHSGRIPITDEADDYRLGWGGTKYTYYNQYYPKTVSATEFTQKRGKKRELFVAVWRNTPRFITNHINRHIVKQFP